MVHAGGYGLVKKNFFFTVLEVTWYNSAEGYALGSKDSTWD